MQTFFGLVTPSWIVWRALSTSAMEASFTHLPRRLEWNYGVGIFMHHFFFEQGMGGGEIGFRVSMSFIVGEIISEEATQFWVKIRYLPFDSLKAPTVTKSASLVYDFTGILLGFWWPCGLSKPSLLTMWSFHFIARVKHNTEEMALIKLHLKAYGFNFFQLY